MPWAAMPARPSLSRGAAIARQRHPKVRYLLHGDEAC